MKAPEAYDSRFIRFLAAVLTPGAVAAWPWLIALGLSQPQVGRWLMQASALPYTAILVVTIVAGLLLEDAGSRLEDLLERRLLHKRAWTAYLRSNPNSLVGHTYITSVVTRLKFELAMPFALLIGSAGVAVVAFWQGVLLPDVAWPLIAISVLAAGWLVFEARETIKLLNKTRRRVFPSAERSYPATSKKLTAMSAMTDDFLAGVIATSETDLKVSLLASGQLEATSYAWYLVDRDYGEERVMFLVDADPDSRLTTVTHREDATDCDKAEMTKKFLSLWDMKPTDWAVILSDGQVNFTLLDQELMAATVAEGFKELGHAFDAKQWASKVSYQPNSK